MKVLLISIDSIINFYYDIGSKTDEELYKFAKDLINNNKEEELAIIFESLKDFEEAFNYNYLDKDLRTYYIKFINL
jgi:hypothetical protein